MFTAIALSSLLTLSTPPNFPEDLAFLNKHVQTLELSSADGARVVLVPAWQGRVATSTYDAKNGLSFGFINYPLIESGEITPHIYPVGGEDRLWFGPEGGQFSLFFKQGDPFDLEHWYTPPAVDTEPYAVTQKSSDSATFEKDVTLKNYSDTVFHLHVKRAIELINRGGVNERLGVLPPKDVKFVAFESRNSVTNTGAEDWNKTDGLISIWILGMLKHSPTTTIILPFNQGSDEDLGPIVNDAYFGKPPSDRIKIKGSTVFFRADGKYRSKVGLNHKRTKGILGSYDPVRKVLTVMTYSRVEGTNDYVNSMWELQSEPYRGDVANAYNDGPPAPGKKPLGPFYELENSSPALPLAPGATHLHISEMYHFYGPLPELRKLAMETLGVDVKPLESPGFWDRP